MVVAAQSGRIFAEANAFPNARRSFEMKLPMLMLLMDDMMEDMMDFGNGNFWGSTAYDMLEYLFLMEMLESDDESSDDDEDNYCEEDEQDEEDEEDDNYCEEDDEDEECDDDDEEDEESDDEWSEGGGEEEEEQEMPQQKRRSIEVNSDKVRAASAS